MAEEGKNKVARSLLDLQPTALLEMFRVYPDRVNKPNEWLGFHGGAIYSESILWQGFQYLPLSMESEGFDILGDGKLARPKIRVANQNNIITQLLQVHKDFKNASFIRKRVSVKFIDDENFEGGNPFGEADPKAELTDETWLMGRKTQESRLFVEFELNSPLDLESASINPRSVISKFCPWQYRGEGCRYQGQPIERSDGQKFQDLDGNGVTPNYSPPDGFVGSFLDDPSAIWSELEEYAKGAVVILESPTIFLPSPDPNMQGEALKTAYVSAQDNNIGQSPEGNPSFWQRDGCTKKLSACKQRFNEVDSIGFAAAQNIDRNFNAIQISGMQGEDISYIPNHTGLFHTTVPELTGQLTGEFTIMGWANINQNSPIGAGILSTSPSDDAGWPNTQWLNINSTTVPPLKTQPIPRRGTRTNGVAANYMDTINIGPWPYTPGEPDNPPVPQSVGLSTYKTINLHEQQRCGNAREWVQYVVTNSYGDGVVNGTNKAAAQTKIKFYVNGIDLSTTSQKLSNEIGNFASLATRETMQWPSPYVGEKALPTTFMLGAVEYWSKEYSYPNSVSNPPYTTSMNGALGPWAVWNRPLNDEEINYLYKRIATPNGFSNSLDFIPRNYDECTGRFGTITGGEVEVGDEIISYGKDSLVAWWDASTGLIGGTTSTGMLDIHTGNIHLTGSGEFLGVAQGYKESPLTLLSNPTPAFPNFGGFPGTDGFSYARNT
jgi:lambda family phage minor tail protein L